jgi:hypothetical protein
MSAVLCAGCGGEVRIPDGYDRGKIRCPECGVLCPVPAASARAAEATPRRARAAAPVPASRPAGRACPDCGAALPADAAAGRCPECAAAAAWAAEAPVAPPARPKRRRATEEAPESEAVPATAPPPATDDEDDGRPYLVSKADEERLCPSCGRVLDAGAVVCPGCDLDLATGKKVKWVFPPVERSWDYGPPAATRWRVFVTGETLVLLLIGGGAALSGELGLMLIPLLVFTALLAFILGSYFHMDLKRDRRGRVRLTRTWHIAFVPLAPTELKRSDFDGVATGLVSENHFWEWWLLLMLLPAGLLPAVIWWYLTIHRPSFYTALTRDHGYSDTIVYRGWSEERMREVADLLREVAGLRY